MVLAVQTLLTAAQASEPMYCITVRAPARSARIETPLAPGVRLDAKSTWPPLHRPPRPGSAPIRSGGADDTTWKFIGYSQMTA